MEESLQCIGDKTLLQIMIPGTHNSASFDKFDHKEQNILNKYSLCQDESVWNQLIYGIRYYFISYAFISINKVLSI